MNVSHSFGKALADVLGHRGGLTQHLHGVRLHFAGPLPAAGGDVGRNVRPRRPLHSDKVGSARALGNARISAHGTLDAVFLQVRLQLLIGAKPSLEHMSVTAAQVADLDSHHRPPARP